MSHPEDANRDEPSSDAAGEVVDGSLLDATLAMTVKQRLLLNDQTIRSVYKLRAGVAAVRAKDGDPRGDAPPALADFTA